MNPRIQKTIDEIERTKAKIIELQALLPELERRRTDLENTEIVKLVRSANVAPGDIAEFIESLKKGRQDSRTNNGQNPQADTIGAVPLPITRQEVLENEEE